MTWAGGVSPAFNLDLSRVLLSSPASGGKSATGLKAVSTTTNKTWKTTLLDTTRSFKVTNTSAKKVSSTSGMLSFVYTGAKTGDNEYISAVLADSNGEAVYYGKIMQPTSADGVVSVEFPNGVATGSYTLKIFNEQVNEDN